MNEPQVYMKLVRDKIPEIIEAKGGHAVTQRLSFTGYRQALKDKLQEEVKEYLACDDNGVDGAHELADIIEVVYALAAVGGCSPGELDAIRFEKSQERGVFNRRLLLIEVHNE